MKIDINTKINVSGIYMIQNINSKKVYIGSALNIYKRIFGASSISHLKALSTNTHSNNHLQNTYNKHGMDSFRFEILEICEKSILLEREQYYFDTLLNAKNLKNFKKKAYNICPTAGSPLGRTMSNAFKKKCSVLKLGTKNPMFGRKGINNPRSLSILQYNKDGNFIKMYNTIIEAVNETKVSLSSIRNSIFKGHQGGGFYWKNYSNHYLIKINTKQEQKKGIIATCCNTNKEFVFFSLTEASNYFKMERKAFSNAIKKAILNNIRYKNYLWKYKN
jgi:group I intron endonuclease